MVISTIKLTFRALALRQSECRRAFSVAAPLLWNSVPQHVRDADSLGIFKTEENSYFEACFFKLIILL